MRLAHANEGRDTVGLLLGEAPMGRSARGASVTLEAAACWRGDSAQSRRLTGLTIQAHVNQAQPIAGDAPRWVIGGR